MPNVFSYMVLFGWLVVILALFRTLPIYKALIWSVLGAYLLLPSKVAVNFPMVPALDKTSVPAVGALLFCMMMARGQTRTAGGGRGKDNPTTRRRGKVSGQNETPGTNRQQLPSARIFTFFVIAVLVTPFLTVLQNGDTVLAGPRVIAGLRLYDGLSLSAYLFIALIPFLLGMRFLAGIAEHRYLVWALTITGVLYAFLVLFEVRMSPRLHIWIYGFFPHDWVQHRRGGAFRPVVFLEHGLAVGLFLATTLAASTARWREAALARINKSRCVAATLWIALALALSSNFAAVALAIIFVPVVLLVSVRKQMLIGTIVVVTFLTFPLLRGADLVPTESIANLAASFDETRADSLRFRFAHEDALLERAQQKPLAGWGGWGRNRLYHERTGADLSVTDGAWVIVIGIYGWTGYLAQFGLMALPLLMLWRQQRRMPGSIDPATAALAMIMALSLLYLIPNDFRNPMFWLVAGALAGRYKQFASGREVAAPIEAPARSRRAQTRRKPAT